MKNVLNEITFIINSFIDQKVVLWSAGLYH